MLGQMMNKPLILSSVLDYAARQHGKTEIVSRAVEGGIHRYTYGDAARRTRQLANAFRTRLDARPGDVIATLAWNTYRHFELYYAISGIGAVCHTVNPRLFTDQIAYIIDHARDRYLFVDLTFVPLLESIADRLGTVEAIIVMTERAHMPISSLANLLCYEDLLADQPETFDWPDFDERTASALCYTSGTTGNPRGVIYSHRSTLLHAFAANTPDVFGLSARDVVLPVVPMFHVNAWSVPYAAAMAGSKLVLPGPAMDGQSLHSLIVDEQVTIALGVPTVWLGLLNHSQSTGNSLGSLDRVVVGGSACPPSMMQAFQDRLIRVIHAWGMTEMSPLGTVNSPTAATETLPASRQAAIALKQGRPPFGVELKIVDDDGAELPWDGVAFGSLKVRGHWVCDSYFRLGQLSSHDDDGWFDTGDVATIDSLGYMMIVDRSKDIIKSGGEWISSIELENIAVGHPAVREAAAISRPDEKWGERPVIVAVLHPGATATPEEIRASFCGTVSRWCEPDEVIIVESLPHTATGKLLKSEIRRLYGQA